MKFNRKKDVQNFKREWNGRRTIDIGHPVNASSSVVWLEGRKGKVRGRRAL